MRAYVVGSRVCFLGIQALRLAREIFGGWGFHDLGTALRGGLLGVSRVRFDVGDSCGLGVVRV